MYSTSFISIIIILYISLSLSQSSHSQPSQSSLFINNTNCILYYNTTDLILCKSIELSSCIIIDKVLYIHTTWYKYYYYNNLPLCLRKWEYSPALIENNNNNNIEICRNNCDVYYDGYNYCYCKNGYKNKKCIIPINNYIDNYYTVNYNDYIPTPIYPSNPNITQCAYYTKSSKLNCIDYFDGCNFCRNTRGKIKCTDNYCTEYKRAYCTDAIQNIMNDTFSNNFNYFFQTLIYVIVMFLGLICMIVLTLILCNKKRSYRSRND